MALLGVLAVPGIARATTGPSGDVGSGDAGAGSGEGTGGGTASEPSSTGEPSTSGATSDDTDTEHTDDHDSGSKGCSIGSHGVAPGMLALALLGLHGLRRRRA